MLKTRSILWPCGRNHRRGDRESSWTICDERHRETEPRPIMRPYSSNAKMISNGKVANQLVKDEDEVIS